MGALWQPLHPSPFGKLSPILLYPRMQFPIIFEHTSNSDNALFRRADNFVIMGCLGQILVKMVSSMKPGINATILSTPLQKILLGMHYVHCSLFIQSSKHMTAETRTSWDVDTEKMIGFSGKISINVPGQ